MKVLLAALFALTGVITSTGVASASSSTPSTSLGYDISFPQCGGNLPASVGFGVVGVNNGHPFSANPCLARELQWASTTLTGNPEFYVNTANPGPSDTSNWPTSQQSPQICLGANSVPCSFDYGWNAAQGSYQNAVSAETQIGASSPGAAATAARWWLDVESGNAWQTIRISTGPTPAAFANDDAVIQGELAYFNSIGVASVGIYSTTSQWKGLMGVTGSTFATTKVWIPGYATLASAQSGCAATSFTGGRVAMIQYPSIGLDGDYQCGLVSTPATSTVSVASSATFTDQLAVSGETSPVTYAQTTGSPYLSVSSTGLISTGAPLAPGTYTVTGTDETTGGDSGTFVFTLMVGTVIQGAPTSALTSVPASATFTDQLAVTGASGTVTYLQSAGAPSMIVSPAGLITSSGVLAAGSYVVRGTATDSSGDKGTFFFNLVVNPAGVLKQNPPIRAMSTSAASATFTDQLAVTGASGTVTYLQSAGAPSIIVSPTGLITTSGALAAGSYVVRGTTTDSSGGKGTFFFNLVVNPVGVLNQNPPIRATSTPATSATFTDQLAVTGASGSVTYLQSVGAPSMIVSPTGLITTSGPLAAGSYVVRGTTTDSSGGKGTFFFNLVVTATSVPPSPSTPPPSVALLVARRVVGHAVVGRTVVLRVLGAGFFGRPLVLSRAGTVALVTKDSGTMLTLRVTTRSRSRRGVFTFTIALANGKVCAVRYVQR